jgi:metal transporter CNNM
MSIDPLFLAIKVRSGTEEEKIQAAKVLPLVRQHYRLLVTLLLLNSLENQALPIFLEPLDSPLVAVLLSVTFILFFGEIIPSAVFTGPDQMKISAKLVPLVRVVMVLFTPLAWPIEKHWTIF